MDELTRERKTWREEGLYGQDRWIDKGKASFSEEKAVWPAHKTEGECNAIDLVEPMTSQNSAIIMTNEQSLHQMRNCQ